MTQSFAWSPGFVVTLFVYRVSFCKLSARQTWTSPFSTWPRTCCLTGVRPSPGLWRHTPAMAPTTWWLATAAAPWCCCKTSVNSSLCVWCKSRCYACCHSPSCSVYFFSGATWWSNRRAWLTSWWRIGDPPKTWRRSWSGSAEHGVQGTVENWKGDPTWLSVVHLQVKICICMYLLKTLSLCPSEERYARTLTFPSEKWPQEACPAANVCA